MFMVCLFGAAVYAPLWQQAFLTDRYFLPLLSLCLCGWSRERYSRLSFFPEGCLLPRVFCSKRTALPSWRRLPEMPLFRPVCFLGVCSPVFLLPFLHHALPFRKAFWMALPPPEACRQRALPACAILFSPANAGRPRGRHLVFFLAGHLCLGTFRPGGFPGKKGTLKQKTGLFHVKQARQIIEKQRQTSGFTLH